MSRRGNVDHIMVLYSFLLEIRRVEDCEVYIKLSREDVK
jgi:hypothetical protein